MGPGNVDRAVRVVQQLHAGGAEHRAGDRTVVVTAHDDELGAVRGTGQHGGGAVVRQVVTFSSALRHPVHARCGRR